MHAHILNGAVADYPYRLRATDGGDPARCAKRIYPQVYPLPGSWEQCSPEQLAALNAVPVVAVERPAGAREITPTLIDGVWMQTWAERPAHDPATQAVRWDGGQWVVEAIPLDQIQAQVGAAVQAMIDDVCRGGVPYFRDIFSARGYVGDPNPAYHARAVALRDWSSSVWTALDEIQADVMAGNRPLPTIAELMGELPGAPG